MPTHREKLLAKCGDSHEEQLIATLTAICLELEDLNAGGEQLSEQLSKFKAGVLDRISKSRDEMMAFLKTELNRKKP